MSPFDHDLHHLFGISTIQSHLPFVTQHAGPFNTTTSDPFALFSPASGLFSPFSDLSYVFVLNRFPLSFCVLSLVTIDSVPVRVSNCFIFLLSFRFFLSVFPFSTILLSFLSGSTNIFIILIARSVRSPEWCGSRCEELVGREPMSS
ncbi:uncharacterized protein EAF01_011009 [Botrytis porri]|uniref:uncharacterized protein n=1 Tax=Botrytis porri TaxID=87229 RepID=UPI0018FFACD1|nr:uncharacterized protein EAF01_011009 [Botrytis porri]KAF7887855.1 hypothetical protein EAF01_011009 [Botrytis porri]